MVHHWLLLTVTLLRSIALAQSDASGHSRFSYASNEFDSQAFVVRRRFNATFNSPASTTATWTSLNGSCTLFPSLSTSTTSGVPTLVANPASNPVFISCTEPGTYSFTVFPDSATVSTDTFSVTVTQGHCYRWHFVTSNAFLPNGQAKSTALAVNEVDPNANLTARIWIVDPTSASYDELSGGASEPSTTSVQLSQGFAALGDVPTLSPLSQPVPSSLLFTTPATFAQSKGFWEMGLTTRGGGAHPVFIGGSDTALMGCSIGPVEPLIFVQPFTDVTQLGLTTTTTPSTSPVTPEYFKVFTDHCTQSVALSISALYGSGVVGFSQSLFTLDPSQLTSLPSSVVGGAGARVVGIAPTRNTLAVLMSDGGLYYASTATPFQKVGGLPSGLDSIRYIDYCDASNLYASVLNSVTVTWSSSTSVIYVSMNGGLTFNNVTLTNGSGAGQVLDVAVQHTTQSLAVLFRSSSTTTMLNYGLTSGAVTESSATVTNGMTKMVAMAMSEVLVYGSGGVQFSPNGGTSLFNVTLSSRDPARPAVSLAPGETVVHVATAGQGGYYAVLTSTNRVFYGHTGLTYAVELIAGIGPTASAVLFFDPRNRLQVLTPKNTAPFVDIRSVPTLNQVISPRSPVSMNPTFTCPFYDFSTTLTAEYDLDYGESASFQVLLTPKSGHSNQISVTFSNSSIISHSTNVTEQSSLDSQDGVSIMKRNGTVVVQPVSSWVTGRVEVQVEPQAGNLACSTLRNIATVTVGCPASKTLKFIPPTAFVPNPPPTPRYDWNAKFSSDYTKKTGKVVYVPTTTGSSVKASPSASVGKSCESYPATVTLPAGSWISSWASWVTGGTEKVVQYNCTKYGDPISMYYGDPFLPIFALYRDSTFSEIVGNDIAIWEDFGQSTFTFNTTAEQAGCRTPPQSLKQFVTPNTTDIQNVWTPETYDKCYDSESSTTTGWNTGVIYTLTNTSNQNALIWTGATNRLYFFTARVMDMNYSYCTLTTHFAVQVYGAPMSAGIQAGFVFGFMAFVLGCLVGSYYIHKGKVLSERADKEKEE